MRNDGRPLIVAIGAADIFPVETLVQVAEQAAQRLLIVRAQLPEEADDLRMGGDMADGLLHQGAALCRQFEVEGAAVLGAATAAQRALERAGWRAADLDLIELNEAFAAQALAVAGVMDWDLERVNVNGGAIALGHPIGASGCRVVVTLLHEMLRRDVRRGLATLCIGGGQGVAICIER